MLSTWLTNGYKRSGLEIFINWSLILEVGSLIIVIFMFFIITIYGIMLIVSLFQMRRNHSFGNNKPYEKFLKSSFIKPVSILVPAYNESIGIYGSVRSLLNIEYPEYEIIIINDGSTDNTLEKVLERFQCYKVQRVIRRQLETKEIKAIYQSSIYENLIVIDKWNGGKADALNAGINVAQYPYIGSLDADSIIEKHAFLKVVKPMMESNYHVIASGGSVRVANGSLIENGEVMETKLSKKPIVLMQVIEYLRAFLIGRIGLSHSNLLLIVSGAFGVFDKKWVVRAGGYADTIGEDMELIVRLHRMIKEQKLHKKIIFVPDSVCWTEVPESIKYLRKQRKRWQKGLFESIWRHRTLLFNPKYGSIGMISMPYYFLIEFLSPIIELAGYMLVIISIFTGDIYVEIALTFLFLSIIYGTIYSMVSVLLEEWSMDRYPNTNQFIRIFFWSLTESFWYRPLTVIWRMEGMFELIFGNREWGEMDRKGVSK
ncbi:cellulose synthase/poly-beta-1,6-N-acetylglucosamine synthase-like glycosyltransferase [Pseudogracilibacillus auburnensis]|uniref:Cellulose synthase/poly-beta-1,6-N-acetylglucosamine synthase-like glycosyltransferase n=1 Tax=Pseudogracilibacillus auburnensis TaxID=1494959 RepID=A0A2V3VGM2_9BACI|nr:cellulose synthase/poly-beta-1,6-N-acetylglucosamine synthase-like glycosyltransferase [Pseudogracilibacillus auburnensis]